MISYTLSLLKRHNIDVVAQDGAVYALEVEGTEDGGCQATWVDVTHWERQDLHVWLGY